MILNFFTGTGIENLFLQHPLVNLQCLHFVDHVNLIGLNIENCNKKRILAKKHTSWPPHILNGRGLLHQALFLIQLTMLQEKGAEAVTP